MWQLTPLHTAAAMGAAAAAAAVRRVPEAPALFSGGGAGSPSQWLVVHWWGRAALVLAQRDGAVSVSSIGSSGLRELLGERPESFPPLPLLSAPRGDPPSFFVLTREAHAVAACEGEGEPRRRRRAAAAPLHGTRPRPVPDVSRTCAAGASRRGSCTRCVAPLPRRSAQAAKSTSTQPRSLSDE